MNGYDITHTITVFELLWTVVALVGVVFTGLTLKRAIGDREWLLDTKDANGDREVREYISVTSILIFLGGTCTQLAYLVVGCIAMTLPNANESTQPPARQLATGIIFIVASVVGTVLAVTIYRRRTTVLRMMAHSND